MATRTRARSHVIAEDGRPWHQVRLALGLLGAIVVAGTVAYVLLGLSPLDALYMTITTVTTVGFREVGDPTVAHRVVTIALVVLGVGTALYTLTTVLEALIEGHLTNLYGSRRMQRRIDQMEGHVVVCGLGRVGRRIADYLHNAGEEVVAVEHVTSRVEGHPFPAIAADATDDAALQRAGIERAKTLVVALNTDADNVYVTLSARSLNPDLFIVARAREEAAEPKLRQAGANRVVNPQVIGGSRIAALVLQPNVTDFLDVVMHDGSLEFRLGEVGVPASSPLAGCSLREAQLRERTGAMVLAMRTPAGEFHTNPAADTALVAGALLIAIGTEAQIADLQHVVEGSPPAH